MSTKYKPEDYSLIKNTMQAIQKTIQEYTLKELTSDDKKAWTKICVLELLEDILMRLKADQNWLHKSVITTFYEYLTLNSTDMLLKAQWIKTLRQVADERGAELFFTKSDYLTFHWHLTSLAASAIDLPTVGCAGLADSALAKWDVGLWRFVKGFGSSAECGRLMDPCSYVRKCEGVVGPEGALNSEWLLVALKNSFNIVGYILSIANSSNAISLQQLKPTVDLMLKAFMLFQVLSELEAPVNPWEVTQERWDESTRAKIVECKTEILKIIAHHLKTRGPVSQLVFEIVFAPDKRIDAEGSGGKHLHSEVCDGCARCGCVEAGL